MNTNPLRGEIWQIDFAPTIGAEISKIRPAIVINVSEAGKLPLRIVVPLTDWKSEFEHFFWFIRIAPTRENGLMKISGADCFQIKSVSVKRFVRKCGVITQEQLDDMTRAIMLTIGFELEMIEKML